MKELLIQLYLFVCQIYDTSPETCFQRLSNNNQPIFTDQELITIWLFAHLNDKFQKKQMHKFIQDYWADWFPTLPAYQTFVFRLNRLEPSFQTFGQILGMSLTSQIEPEIDTLTDSMPVMLAQNGHSYAAKVAREVADAGYCAAKKTRFHGVRLHFTAKRQHAKLPRPQQIWLCGSSHHDSKAFKEQHLELAETDLFGDKAFADRELENQIKEQNSKLITPVKKPKNKDLTEFEKYHSRLVSKFRQPIESLFNWINEKTGIQKASKVRSTDALMIHCWGKLVVAFYLLVFNY